MTGKAILSLWTPGGLLFLAAVVLVQWKALAAWLPNIIVVYPLGVVAAAILLGWRFNRSRLVFAVLVLAITDRSLLYFASGPAASTDSGKLFYNAAAVLMPLNLAILSLIKERGIFTAHGIWRTGLILAQPLTIAAICHFHHFALNNYLTHPIVKASLLVHIPPLPLPQPALLASMAAFFLLGFGFIKHKGAIESGFLWALPVSFLALAAKPGSIATIYFSTAGLILIIAVIEASRVMAFRDELTGLPARHSLNEFLLRMGKRYTVAMVDIDFFKKFNDTHGHDVGDQVLRMVASKLCAVTGGGTAFRYGGEEFAVIFPRKPLEETMPHLEQLRMVIGSTGFVIRSRKRPRKKPDQRKRGKELQKRVSVTVSMGVAERKEQHADPHDVIKAADRALYRAKKAGRNRVST